MQVKKYFEKKVSLLSTSDVRYDGELYTVDPSEQSIALKHVNCMGTEGRRTGDQAIAPSDCTYEFIIFRAVNIRELWLDEGNGRRRDLTEEILIPLRSGQSVNNYPKQRQDMYEPHDAPKRKVGYQSRSAQQQGYDPYYGGGYDPYYGSGGGRGGQASGGGGGGGGYGPPPQAPPPNQYESTHQYAPPPPQTYYDTPSQNNYYYSSGQQQQRPAYNQRSGQPRGQYNAPPQYSNTPMYNQRQRQRPPQYYNQQQRPPQYYNQGYPSQYGPYSQQRRYQNQRQSYGQQRGYGQRGYSRGYNQSYNTQRGDHRRQRTDYKRSTTENQAGTGAFLDNRRLRGDEIDIKDQQDFDFGAATNEFAATKDNQTQQNGVNITETTQTDKEVVNPTDDKADKEEVNATANANANANANENENAEAEAEAPAAADDDNKNDKNEEETKEDEDHIKKYDKNKSFFDGLQTETKKSKPKQDLSEQKKVDATTFGSVAATYKSRHINRQTQRGYNQNRRNRNYQSGYSQQYQSSAAHYQNQQRGYNYQNQQRGYNTYNTYRQQYQRQQPQQNQNSYTTSKWVRR